MKATSTLRPSASSPSSVHGPSARTWPFEHLLADPDDRPLVDAGVLVRPLELGQLVDVGAHLARHLGLALDAHDDALAVDVVDRCRRAAPATTAPESRAVMYSMPVPTYGASARSSGTAWRCMFDPISARLASSFSRNGISDAATETSCFGETSMYSISSRGASMKLPAWRALTRSVDELRRSRRARRWPGR